MQSHSSVPATSALTFVPQPMDGARLDAQVVNMLQRNFETFLKTPSGKRGVTLLKKSPSARVASLDPSAIYNEVFDRVTDSIPGMVPGYCYTAEQLCGVDCWAPWKRNAAGILAGMCLAHSVKTGAIPLVMHQTRSGSGCKKYLRILAECSQYLTNGHKNTNTMGASACL